MKVIAVDFDGTLCTSAWPEIGKENWPVIAELKRRRADGDKIILWTCRAGALLDKAVEWCHSRGLNFDAINGNVPERIEQYGNDSRKVSADEYWDDRAVLICAQAGDSTDRELSGGTSPIDAEQIRRSQSEKTARTMQKPALVWLCAKCAQDMIGAGLWYQEQPQYSNGPETCRWCKRLCYGTPYLVAYRTR